MDGVYVHKDGVLVARKGNTVWTVTLTETAGYIFLSLITGWKWGKAEDAALRPVLPADFVVGGEQ